VKSSVLREALVSGFGLVARGCLGLSWLERDLQAGPGDPLEGSRAGQWVLSSTVHRELWEQLCAARTPPTMRLADVSLDGVGNHLVLRLTALGWEHQIVLPRAASEVQSWLRESVQRRSVLLALRYVGAAQGAVLGLELGLGIVPDADTEEGMSTELGGYLPMVAGLACLMERRGCLRDAVADGRAPRESLSPLLPQVLEPSGSVFAELLSQVAIRP